MSTVALAIGLVLVVEGLVLALAPDRLEDIVRAIAEIPPERRRAIGLGVVFAGTLLIWMSKSALS